MKPRFLGGAGVWGVSWSALVGLCLPVTQPGPSAAVLPRGPSPSRCSHAGSAALVSSPLGPESLAVQDLTQNKSALLLSVNPLSPMILG